MTSIRIGNKAVCSVKDVLHFTMWFPCYLNGVCFLSQLSTALIEDISFVLGRSGVVSSSMGAGVLA